MKNIQVFILNTSFWLCSPWINCSSAFLSCCSSWRLMSSLCSYSLHWLLFPAVRIALGDSEWLIIPTLFFLTLYFSFLGFIFLLDYFLGIDLMDFFFTLCGLFIYVMASFCLRLFILQYSFSWLRYHFSFLRHMGCGCFPPLYYYSSKTMVFP